MSAETFTTAIFLVTAVIAAGVLVNALFPVVYTMVGTFSSASHESDVQLRTDFKIITTFASGTKAQIWMKNIGSSRIPENDLSRSDVFYGSIADFDRMSFVEPVYPPVDPGINQWTYDFGEAYDLNLNYNWDPGETIKITAISDTASSTGDIVYFQFALPSGIWRSTEFTAR